ncbi:MAG: hypothetical protein ACOC2H_08780 [Spirochaetota bacterium]
MKKTVLVLILAGVLHACESTDVVPEFIPERIEDTASARVTCKSKEGVFYLFTATVSEYTITVTEMNNDLDLTFGHYDDSNQYEDQRVIAVSKSPGLSDERIVAETTPGCDYLIEVFNYSSDTAHGTLVLEQE